MRFRLPPLAAETRRPGLLAGLACVFAISRGAAQPLSEPTESPTAKPKPPLYSLPFQLRPAVAASVIRSDTSLGIYEDPVSGDSGSTVASLLFASYKLSDELAPLVRLGVVSNSPPAGPAGTGFLNPVLGALYGLKPSPALRLAFFLGLALPMGSGGGNSPDPGRAAANLRGIAARAAMDNAMFAVNDFTVFPGVDLAFLAHGFTLQLEATLFQLTRVRGDELQPDASRTNMTGGLHVGYFLTQALSLAAELRHQRWLSTPKAVAGDAALRDTSSVAFGARVHFQIGPKLWLRPGLAFAVPLDDPLQRTRHKLLQIDLPLAF